MHIIDIVIIAIIVGYCAWILYNHFTNKDFCTHSCSSCSSTSCHVNDFKKDIKEAKKEIHNGW